MNGYTDYCEQYILIYLDCLDRVYDALDGVGVDHCLSLLPALVPCRPRRSFNELEDKPMQSLRPCARNAAVVCEGSLVTRYADILIR